MCAEYPGAWEFNCNVAEHYAGGMRGILRIGDVSVSPNTTATALTSAGK